jgi:hypothetical protein
MNYWGTVNIPFDKTNKNTFNKKIMLFIQNETMVKPAANPWLLFSRMNKF